MKKLIDFYKKNKNYFSLMEKTHDEGYYSLIFNILKKLKFPLKGKKVLDVGSGTGKFLRLLKKEFGENFSGTGIDTSNLGEEFHTRIKFIQGDAHNLPFKKNFYDFVFSIDTLEHLLNPQKAVEEMYRVTKDKGIIIIRTRNFRSLLTKFDIKNFSGLLLSYLLKKKEDLTKTDKLIPVLDNKHLGGDYDAVSAIFADRLKETFLRKKGKILLFSTWTKSFLNFLNYVPFLRLLGSMCFLVFKKSPRLRIYKRINE